MDEAHGVEPGTLWDHWKGRRYVVLHLATDEASGAPVVVYTAYLARAEKVWVRPLADWLATVDTPAGPVPRFVRVG